MNQMNLKNQMSLIINKLVLLTKYQQPNRQKEKNETKVPVSQLVMTLKDMNLIMTLI